MVRKSFENLQLCPWTEVDGQLSIRAIGCSERGRARRRISRRRARFL